MAMAVAKGTVGSPTHRCRSLPVGSLKLRIEALRTARSEAGLQPLIQKRYRAGSPGPIPLRILSGLSFSFHL